MSEKVSIDSENQQTPQSRRLTSHEGEFIFFQSIISSYKKFYYDTGEIWKEGNLNNHAPNGNWTYYYKSGYKLLQGQFQDGRAFGKWTWYNDDGIKAIEANLMDGSIDALELKLYDFMIQQQEPEKSDDVVIVELNETSKELIPDFLPYSRTIWGQVITNLAKANAKVIIIDLYIFK